MKIAMMVRGYITAPQPKDIIYAPIELAINTAEGLVQRGHKVDFYAPQGSRLKANIKTLNLRPLTKNLKEFQQMLGTPNLVTHYVPGSWDSYLAIEMFQQALKGRYDLLYFVHPEVALPLAKIFPQIPVVYSLHDPIYPWYKNIFNMYKTPSQHFISISNNQRRPAQSLNYAGTIYNGIDPSLYPFSDSHDDYLIYVGRIVPEKGVKEAVQIARKTNNKLLIIGVVFPDNVKYFNKFVRPYLNDKISYLGYIKRSKLARYYKRAKALLSPLQWEEPFGMTFLESMVCGTPVIALKRGSAPEVIADGKTGFVVDSIKEMIKAVDNIDQINRLDCRKHVEANFSLNKMVDNYEAAFEQVIRRQNRLKTRTPK